jgi:hypothetical protein
MRYRAVIFGTRDGTVYGRWFAYWDEAHRQARAYKEFYHGIGFHIEDSFGSIVG